MSLAFWAKFKKLHLYSSSSSFFNLRLLFGHGNPSHTTNFIYIHHNSSKSHNNLINSKHNSSFKFNIHTSTKPQNNNSHIKISHLQPSLNQKMNTIRRKDFESHLLKYPIRKLKMEGEKRGTATVGLAPGGGCIA